MKPLHTLNRYLPGHLAMNAALLIRKLRPVFQVDDEDVARVDDVRRAVRAVSGLECETWRYALGQLVWIRGRKIPSDVSRAIASLRSLPADPPTSRCAPLIRTCLRLRCPVSAFDTHENRFRVLMSVSSTNGDTWSFKQQMCIDASDVRSLLKELVGYSDVADEMGFITVELKVVKVHTRFHSPNMPEGRNERLSHARTRRSPHARKRNRAMSSRKR